MEPMSAAEHAFITFLRDGRFGPVHANITKEELLQMLPELWEAKGATLPPYTLFSFESFECTFENDRLRQIKIRFHEEYDSKPWIDAFNIHWYGLIYKMDMYAMRAFLERNMIAYRCLLFIDESNVIQIVDIPISICFWPDIQDIYRYYMGMTDWRGSDLVREVIEFP